MMMYFKKCRVLCIVLMVGMMSSGQLNAQIDESENTMAWTGISMSKKLNKKWSFNYSQLHSIALDELEFNFIQSNFKASRKLEKGLYVNFGYKPTLRLSASSDEDAQRLFHRLFGEIQYTQKYGDFRFQHKLGGEHHFTPVAKFQQRFYYSLKSYYRNNDLPLKLRPYLTQKLFYYQGGNPIPVDEEFEEGELEIIEIQPNGLHAYRAQLGVRMSLTERINWSIYYMKQWEFNTPFGGEDINVENIETGKIAAPFYNFGVIGTSISFKF